MPGVKGKSGRRPEKSVDERKLEGSFRPVRHNKYLAREGKLEMLEVPSWVKLNKSETEIFDRYAKFLHDNKQTEAVDVVLLLALVDYQYLYDKSVAAYRKSLDAKFGQRPCITVARECQKEIANILAEFSLTPTTRISEKPEDDEEKDDVHKFMNIVLNNPPKVA